MLVDLRAERTQIQEAIIVLERLAQGHGKRRGRAAGLDDSSGRTQEARASPRQQEQTERRGLSPSDDCVCLSAPSGHERMIHDVQRVGFFHFVEKYGSPFRALEQCLLPVMGFVCEEH